MSDWKKAGDGKWVPTKAPPVPPRNRPAAAATAGVPPAPLTGYTAQFNADPLMFLRKHSMSPPDNAGAMPGRQFGLGNDANTDIAAGALNNGVVTRNAGGGVRFTHIIPHPAPNFAGAMCLRINTDGTQPDTSWLPIHWLPWFSQQIIEYKIPPVPSSLVEPPEDSFPRLFFTAGINGCSVFVRGEADSPTISHAGITGTLKRPAGQFWRDQMTATGVDLGGFKIKGEVNRADYMWNDLKESKLADDFLKWKSSDSNGKFTLENRSPFGCVFGIMYGRHWTFYLQESILMAKVDFLKGGEAKKFATSVGETLNTKSKMSSLQGGKVVLEQETSKYLKTVTYRRSIVQSLPLRVSEIYPRKTWSTDLRDTFAGGAS